MNDESFTHQARLLTIRRSRRSVLGALAGGALVFGAGRQPDATAQTFGYAHANWLVDANWLLDRAGDPGLRVVTFASAEEFVTGHIPGALRLDGPALALGDTSGAAIARWRGEMERLFAERGIGAGNTVVACDAGTLFATRPWWVLRVLGHDHVRVLDGGLAAWQAVGGPIAAGPAAGADSAIEPAVPLDAFRADMLAPLGEVRDVLGDPRVVIVDTRTPEEYADGHIPGAVNVSYPLNAVAAPPKTWKPAAELRAIYEAAGVTSDKRIIPYCNTGVRSSVTDFTLRLLGYEDVALYSGSWNEWNAHPELPVATGPRP
ncbi:MAG: sulfurtransferase [Thermomicrobiales bacterium]|nr:sulfurtransferase [Thermomicrobiales bacterium]